MIVYATGLRRDHPMGWQSRAAYQTNRPRRIRSPPWFYVLDGCNGKRCAPASARRFTGEAPQEPARGVVHHSALTGEPPDPLHFGHDFAVIGKRQLQNPL